MNQDGGFRSQIESVDSGSADAAREVLIWDDQIRERGEYSSLYFWRLSFVAEYAREEIFEVIRQLCLEVHVTSRVSYETLGEFDLLVRLWIPRRSIAEEIELLLRARLAPYRVWGVHYICCHTMVHWAKDNVRLPGPDEPLPVIHNSTLEAVNAFNETQFRLFEQSKQHGSDEPPPQRPVDTTSLIEGGWLISVPLSTRGVRCYVVFDRPVRPLTAAEERVVLEEIQSCCDAVEASWGRSDTGTGSQRRRVSIYAGRGTMSDYLLLARAPYGHFHQFVRDLVLNLRGAAFVGAYQMRPYTYVLADEMFSDFREHRTTATASADRDWTLAQEEEGLELKATFAVNIRRLRADGKAEADDRTKDQVVKAVCGLLNSPGGGVLAIGVLEVARELEKAEKAGNKDGFVDWLRKEFDYALPDDAGTLDSGIPNAVLGVGLEVGENRPYKDLERFLGAVRDTLRERIEPNPWSWLQMAPLRVDGTQIVVISIRPADTWCYATVEGGSGPEFFVREAVSTRRYSGVDADFYRSAHPRRSGSTGSMRGEP